MKNIFKNSKFNLFLLFNLFSLQFSQAQDLHLSLVFQILHFSFLKSEFSREKDEVCHGFLVDVFTKSLLTGTGHWLIIFLSAFFISFLVTHPSLFLSRKLNKIVDPKLFQPQGSMLNMFRFWIKKSYH